MLGIIAIIITILIGFNFMLLKFSCTKTAKKPILTKLEKPKIITTSPASIELAPTGS